MENIRQQIKTNEIIKVKNETKGFDFEMKHPLSGKSLDILLEGGKLNYTKNKLIK